MTKKKPKRKAAPKLFTQAQMDAAVHEACVVGHTSVEQTRQVMEIADKLKQEVINLRGEFEKAKKIIAEEAQKAMVAQVALESIGAPGLSHPMFDAYIDHVAHKMGILAYVPPEKRSKS